MNASTIRRSILTVLGEVAPHALPAAQLLESVNRMVRPSIDGADLYEHCRALLDRSLVGFLPDDLDPDDGTLNRWLITEAGQATLKR